MEPMEVWKKQYSCGFQFHSCKSATLEPMEPSMEERGEMSEKKDLRQQMPGVTAFIDQMRDAFGKEDIDQMIRAGMQGKPNCFHARENGIEVGTAFEPVRKDAP